MAFRPLGLSLIQKVSRHRTINEIYRWQTSSRNIIKILFLFCSVTLNLFDLKAQDGTCDLSFHLDPTNAYPIEKIVIQGDGKILAVCPIGNDYTLKRFNINGDLDTTFRQYFSTYQISSSNSTIRSIALQNDGKILIGGHFDRLFYSANAGGGTFMVNKLARINSNGTVDTTFHPPLFGNYVNAIAVKNNGKIIVAGDFYSIYPTATVVQLNPNGTLDSTFNAFGYHTSNNPFLALQSNGKIIVKKSTTGYNMDLIRLNIDGSKDLTFNFDTTGNGITSSGFGSIGAIHVQSDDKIFIGGDISLFNGISKKNIIRFNANGSLDSTFLSNTNSYNNQTIYDIKTQTDGKVLIAGNFIYYNGNPNKKNFTRLHSNGKLDSTFIPPSYSSTYNSAYTTTDTPPNCIAVLNSGKILVGGGFNRYTYGVPVDPIFGNPTVVTKNMARINNSNNISTNLFESNNNEKFVFHIFPNPTNDYITIDCSNYNTLNNYTVKITNSLGQIVFTTSLRQQSSSVKLSGLTGNGIYFVQIIDGRENTIGVKKIILQ